MPDTKLMYLKKNYFFIFVIQQQYEGRGFRNHGSPHKREQAMPLSYKALD